VSLTLLGDATVVFAGTRLRLERKTAAVLAYLTLAGPTSRQRLAGLLWPDVDEKRARNSLAQLLHRLRSSVHPGVVTGTAVVELGEGVASDVGEMKLAAFEAGAVRAVDAAGELLQNFEYDDCPEFAEWLESEREAVRQQAARSLLQRAAELEAAGRLTEALDAARRLRALDPLAETPYRLAMRLHAKAGDRAAALAAFAECRATLERELGVEPSPELRELAEEVARGAVPVARGARQGPDRPPSAPEPAVRGREGPRLVGREEELARLREAWEAGLPVYVSGPAGVGKSRLAYEFAASQGRLAVMEARPGDAAVPLLTLSRACRRVVADFPGLVLEGWVRTELSRLVPELSESAPPPLRSDDDRVRFQAAIERLRGIVAGHAAGWLFDDVQFADEVSVTTWWAATHALGRAGPGVAATVAGARTIVCFRDDEVPQELLERVEELEARGEALHLRLGPLSADAVASLVAESRGGEAGALAEDLYRYTGGHPLSLVETLRHLEASGRLPDRLPERLPPPGRVTALVRRRVERLSAPARRLVDAAAVMQSDLDLELLAAALGEPAVALAEAWGELEGAGVVSGNRFAHDLVHEAVLAAVAQPVRTLLHRRLAAVLEAAGAPSARVAGHWLAGGRQREAMHALVKAGAEAEAGYRLLEARDYYRRAADIAELLDDQGTAFEALARELELVLRDDTGRRAAALLERLEAAVRTPAQAARADVLAATRLNTSGQPRAAEERARAGLAALAGEGAEAEALRTRLLEALATALSEQNRYDEALAALQQVSRSLEAGGSAPAVAANQLAMGAVLNRAWRNLEALEHQRAARRAFVRAGDRYMTAVVDMHVGVSHESLGDLAEAEAAYLRAGEVLQGIPGAARFTYNNDVNLAYLYWGQERYAEALEKLADAEEAVPATQHSRALVARIAALVYRALGRKADFEREIAEALRRPDRTDPWRSHARIVWAEETAMRGRVGEARDMFAQVERDLGEDATPILRGFLYLAQARSLPGEDGQRALTRARELVEERGLPLLAEVELRHAGLLMAAGRPDEASAAVERALEANARQPLLGQRAELWFTRYRALKAAARRGAGEALVAARRHVLEVAERHVPAEMRAAFLGDNPLNAAVLAEARATGR
jgi:DNA-binding SARP family transcriptional activator